MTSLIYTVLAEYGLQPDPDCTDADLHDIERSYVHRGGVFCVLETEGDAIIGSYGLYPLTAPDRSSVGAPRALPTTCELRKMYLRRDHRGRGLGRRLLEHALFEARRLGFERITLETASVLVEAIHLYESCGFIPYIPDHLSRRCDQAYILELK